MINLTDKATEICRTLRHSGFEGIHFENVYVERVGRWRESYCTFITQLDVDFLELDDVVSQFVIPMSFNEEGFNKALLKFITTQVNDPDVEIAMRKKGSFHQVEWELIRKSYVHPTTEHQPYRKGLE